MSEKKKKARKAAKKFVDKKEFDSLLKELIIEKSSVLKRLSKK